MLRTTVELTVGTVFGIAFLVVGLVILAYVSITAFQLATGVIEPLSIEDTGLTEGMDVFLGILLQIGMFAILVLVAYILMRFGIILTLRKEKSSASKADSTLSDYCGINFVLPGHKRNS